MSFNTLQIVGGAERSFAAWGFARDAVKQTRRNKGDDVFSAFIPGSSVADPVFPFEAQVVVRTGRTSSSGADNSFAGGVVKFSGKAMPPVAVATGAKRGATYQFIGPWYDLSNTHYEQLWKGGTPNPFAIGEIILNTGVTPAGSLLYISIGDQIQAILQWLLDQYSAQGLAAPFQYAGRALNPATHTVDLSTSGKAAAPGQNTDKAGNIYVQQLAANPTIDQALFAQFLVSYIAKPMMCSQALEKMLELSPRTNICFDYSTTPPTCYVRSIDNFAPVNLALFNGIDHKSLNIKRRDDLRARAVKITYRITNTVNGQQGITYAADKWGPNGFNNPADPSSGLRVLSETIDLQGFSQSTTSAQMDCEPLAAIGGNNATKRAWWSSRRGGEQAKFLDSRVRFQDFAFNELDIPDASFTYATTDGTGRVAGQPLSAADLALFTNRIVQGTYHDWMAGGNTPVFSIKVRVSMKVPHAIYDQVATNDHDNTLPANEHASNIATNGKRQGRVNTEDTHVNLQLTNAANGPGGAKFTASTVSSITAGELFIQGPGGIAQYLFNALQPFQYEGEYAKVESVFANNVNLTNAVNFTGGRAEWANMNAQIQEIEEDYGTFETSVKIGVANHLNAGQLSSLLNMWAFRRPWYNPALRADNSAGGDGGEVQMPDNAGGANSTDGVLNHNEIVTTDYVTYTDPTSAMTGQISANANKVTTTLAAVGGSGPQAVDPNQDPKIVDPKEIVFCDESGALQYAIALISGFYTKQ